MMLSYVHLAEEEDYVAANVLKMYAVVCRLCAVEKLRIGAVM